jgi:predicted signal transduction protein with EAL and GGDEF domain
LHALSLTKIKIDRSFVSRLHERPASLKIVKSMLALSKDMGLDCVIEGVETNDEISSLRALGGNLIQGYFFSEPLAENHVDSFLKLYQIRNESTRTG